jgi:hypothetical protein
MKIDGCEKCTTLKSCEVVPGKRSLEVTYNWWTKEKYDAVIAGAISGTPGLCIITAGMTSMLGIPIARRA